MDEHCVSHSLQVAKKTLSESTKYIPFSNLQLEKKPLEITSKLVRSLEMPFLHNC